ncbi:MAG: threonylcarbamoyl-AMP synthase [Candidatus Omnitrophica bacterium]|nr:threonylcarbamoyl-AMP synthase [Candidatus Omnitrophota bacterium]
MSATKVLTIDSHGPCFEAVSAAGEAIRQGGLVIIPTETVYGIAANMNNPEALKRLNTIKQRPPDKPYPMLLADIFRVDEHAQEISPAAYRLMYTFWPGPLTLIFKAKKVTQGSTIGIRIPDHDIAARIVRQAQVPVVCPSANVSGRPAPINFADALRDLDGLVDLALDAGPTSVGKESSVVDTTVVPVRVMREGAIAASDLQTIAFKKRVLMVCTGNSCRSVMAEWLLRKKLQDKARVDIEVTSGGTMMLEGLNASSETLALLKQEGIDASQHHSKRLTRAMVLMSDVILVMERVHEEYVKRMAPEIKNRVFLLKEFAKIEDNNLTIADPIGRSPEVYADTFAAIKQAIERVVEIL